MKSRTILAIAFGIALTLSLTFYAGSRWGYNNAYDEIVHVQGIMNSALAKERAMNKSCSELVQKMHKHMAKERVK